MLFLFAPPGDYWANDREFPLKEDVVLNLYIFGKNQNVRRT